VKKKGVSQKGLAVNDALPADIPDPMWPWRPEVLKATMQHLEVKVPSLVIGEGWPAWLATAWAVIGRGMFVLCVMMNVLWISWR